MSQLKKDLIKARAYVAKGWCQGAYALDVNDAWVSPTKRAADAWCATGACRAAIEKKSFFGGLAQTLFGDDHSDEKRLIAIYTALAESSALPMPPGESDDFFRVVYYNDSPERTKEEVLAMFDKAIEAAE